MAPPHAMIPLIACLPSCLHWHPDGEIRVVGHRIGLYSVMKRHLAGRTPEEILEELPTLSLDEIRGILSFDRGNRHLVNPYVEEYRAELDRQEAESVPSPAQLRIRRLMEERKAQQALRDF
ncbi:MAG: DUF433 domain-containing protein [Isosphaeraceae bacterium]